MTARARTWVGVAIFAATAVGLYPLLAPLRLKPANLILITLDTPRADRLEASADRAALMPTLESWAREGFVFDDALAGAPLTLPAHASLMTGRTPPSDGVVDNSGVLADEAPTLAESLQSVGYQTGAFVSSVALDKRHGLGRGFDVYSEVNRPGLTPRERRPANETVEEALSWLETAGTDSFFLWVHLDDAPASLPDPFRAAYATDPSRGALAFIDSQLRRIQQFLESRQLTGRTAIVVATDRGGSLGDAALARPRTAGRLGVAPLPLIVDWPGLPPGHVETAIELADVAPTVAALDQAPRFDTDGCSLEPLLRGQPMLARALYTDLPTAAPH